MTFLQAQVQAAPKFDSGDAAWVLAMLMSNFFTITIVTIIWVVWSIVYQQVENTVIQPRIQQRTVQVHPFIVLVSVLFGATLLGIVGALVAIPVAASIQIVLREWWDYRHELEVASEKGPPPPTEPGPAGAAA